MSEDNEASDEEVAVDLTAHGADTSAHHASRISSIEESRDMTQRDPYNLSLYVKLGEQYLDLGYPDLAAGAAYKALLLCDAVEDESDEYHEAALQALQALRLETKSGDTISNHVLSSLPIIAFLYCSQGHSKFPDSRQLKDIQDEIRRDVCNRLEITVDALDSGEYGNPSSWPDAGFVRRERYPWNLYEPDRLNDLTVLNEMMKAVAPKLEVLAVDLPDLTNTNKEGESTIVKQLGVFAKEDLQPGNTVLRETSILTANNKLQDALCDACSGELPGLATAASRDTVSCPDCAVVFCSQHCYEEAMELYHPALCDMDVESIAKDVKPTEASDSLYALLLLRALAMAETQHCHPLNLKEVKYIWGDFQIGSADSSDPTSPEKTLPFSFEQNIRLPFHMLEKMDIDIFANPQYDVWVFNTLYAKFRGTASARLSGLGGRMARGPEVGAVHPMWCLANHSCDPNVSWDWGGSIEFRVREQRADWRRNDGTQLATKSAGVKKGEEILNHYCDIDLAVKDRREWARGALGGDCRCARCIWESGEVD